MAIDDTGFDNGFDPAAFLSGRGAVEISERNLRVGGEQAGFDPGDVTTLLTAYLTLVRKLRRQRREAVIVLRADDVSALAEHVGETPQSIIERLGALMGATRAQRTAMASLFATGALVLGLASAAVGVAAPKSSGSGSSQASSLLHHAVSQLAPIEFVDHAPTTASSTTVVIGTDGSATLRSVTAPVAPETTVSASSTAAAPTRVTTAGAEHGPTAHAAPSTTAPTPSTAPSGGPAPTSTAVAPGSATDTLVVLGDPPLPPGVTVAPDSAETATTTPTTDTSSTDTSSDVSDDDVIEPWLVIDPEVPHDVGTTVAAPMTAPAGTSEAPTTAPVPEVIEVPRLVVDPPLPS